MFPLRPSGYLAILSAAVLAIFIGYFATGTTTVQNLPRMATSSGLSVLPTITLPEVELPPLTATSTPTLPATKTATTTVPAKTTPAAKPPATPAQPVSTPVVVSTPVTSAPTGDISASASEIRGALVNIICDAPASTGLHSISGSGVVIDPRGIILTNSHIGQYFLLRNLGVQCVIRTGSPAQDAYYASLAFISRAWLTGNATALTQAEPTGTGEFDFAILAVTRSATDAPLPTNFAYAPLANDAPELNEPVVIGSYAAQFLQSSQIESALYPTIVYGSIHDVFTFQTTTVDVVSLGGSAAAQEGSSGGGVVDAQGDLVATITTSTTQGDTSARQLNAITASYIRRDYVDESGGTTLATLLAESPANMIAGFAPQIPSLEAIITADLPN